MPRAEELFGQPALAHSGLAEDRDEPAGSLGGRSVDLSVQPCQLLLPPDERGPGAGDAGRHAVREPEQPVGRDRIRLALQRERLDGLRADGLPRQPPRQLAEQHLPHRRSLLEPRCHVHRVAAHEGLAGARVARDHLAGVDPDPQADSRAETALELVVQLLEASQHVGGRADGAERVVLVRDGHAEDGHDRVADELLDGRPVLDEDLAHSRERPAECGAKHFGVVRPGRPARIHDVRKEDGHDLPFLRHGPSLRAP